MAGVLGVRSGHSIGAGDRGLAWDVYLAYAHGRDPGLEPDFWMHQLNVSHAPRLDAEEWQRQVEGLLA